MKIIFFNKSSQKYFESVQNDLRPRLGKSFEILEEYNYKLMMPFSKPLGGGLFELRIIGDNQIRFIYTFYKKQIWILHAFSKKTESISKKDIEYARKQYKMLLQ